MEVCRSVKARKKISSRGKPSVNARILYMIILASLFWKSR